jgi:hypothetical protein
MSEPPTGMAPVGSIQLTEDTLQMVLDRLVADGQPLRDLPVR